MNGKLMNKYVFFILLGVLIFFNSCKTYKVIRYESKDFKVFEKKIMIFLKNVCLITIWCLHILLNVVIM